MGMGMAPSSGHVISWDNIKKLCPVQSAMLEAALEAEDVSLDDYARDISDGNDLEVHESIDNCFAELQEAFAKATEVEGKGLNLTIFYYDSENGDRYDDLADGANWDVTGMTVLSPAGEKFKDIVQFQQWTVFG